MTDSQWEDDSSKPSPSCSKTDPKNGSLWSYVRIFSYADATGLALYFVSLVAAIGAGSSLPLMTIIFGRFVTKFNSFAVGDLSPSDFRKEVNSNALWFIYLFVAKFVLGYTYTVCVSVSAMRTTKSMRVSFLKSALRQEVGFFDVWKGGSAAAKVTADFNRIHHGIAEKLGFAVQSLATLFAAFIVAFTSQWKLAIITAVIIPTILIVTGICATIDIKQESAINRLHAQAISLAEEVFSSMRTVQAFWAYRPLSTKYGGFIDSAYAKGVSKWLNLGILYSTEFGCVYAGYALAFWQGFRMYSSGEIQDPGKIVTVIFAVVFAASSISQLAGQITVFTGAASSASGLFEILDRQSHVDPLSEQGLRPGQSRGQIELRDVHFAYPSRPDFPVLKGVTLSIPSDKTTALVGASGSGKSTLVGLIERWYQPARGAVTLDGVPLDQLSVAWLRSQIRLVGQEPVLFQGTIEQNVLNGLIGTTLEHVTAEKKRELLEEACKIANAHDFIMELPEGYQTQVGNAAGMLSGGQKQRIAIARSIISNPRILLMDEPTSALDSQSEHLVQDALDKAAGNRTTVIIAHKLATIRKADNIAVLSGGVIIEQGTYDELKAKGGTFARMVSAQHLGDIQHDSEASNDTEISESAIAHATTNISQQLTKEPTRSSLAGIEDASRSSLGYGLVKCLRIVFSEHRSLWPWHVFMFFLCILGGLAFPAQGILFAKAVEVLQLEGTRLRERGNFFALMFFVLALANFAMYFAMAGASNFIAQSIIRHYRMEIFANSLRQDLRFFDRPENSSGALASRLSSVPVALQDLLGFNISLIVVIIVNIIASSTLALIVGWKLGLAVVFGIIPPLVFFGYLRIRLETRLESQNIERFSESASLAGEAMTAIRTVSSLSMELDVISRYTSCLEAIERRSAGSIFWTMFWFALSQSLDALALCLGFWYGGKLISQREYTTTQFFIVFTAVFFSAQAAAQFFGFTTSMSKATSALNYLLWLRTAQPSIQENSSNRASSPNGDASVCLDAVRFAYPTRPRTAVLKGVSAKVNEGQFAAVVGASGSGKSTVIALLERFYDPTSGRILFGNDDVSKLSPRLYRQNASLVQQEPSLYQGSIFDNVALGVEEGASEEMVKEACRQANILDFILSLPEGFSTPCGSRGAQLSGGQRQRIAIARALIRNPRLLLLDEATSALDTESERIVQEALLKASTGRTTVVVAHRLSTIVNASVIFVFSAGRIAEVGNHEELLSRRGIYYNLCMAQALDQA